MLMLGALLSLACSSEQRIDRGWFATLPNPPTYEAGSGPTVWIDEGHNNIVATTGRYEPFVEALRADGYVVKALRSEFTRDALSRVQLLVIGNALSDRNVDAWQTIEEGGRPAEPTPTYSAFTNLEIDAIHEWVLEGGGLLLLTDHMPFAGASADLGHRFGFTFLDGFVEDSETGGPVEFSLSDGTLLNHPISRGFGQDTEIEFVATFVGQAFQAEHADPLLILGPPAVAFQPDIPWDYDEHSPRLSVAGWLQGAAEEVGAGRVAVFGDATMFSAQLTRDGRRMGMNHDRGIHNLQFLLNVMQWLGGFDGPE
jgi:hypothetical protein